MQTFPKEVSCSIVLHILMELVQFLVILKIHNYKYSILGSVTLYILYNMVQYLSLVLLLPWLRYKMTGLFILKAYQFFLKFQRVN